MSTDNWIDAACFVTTKEALGSLKGDAEGLSLTLCCLARTSWGVSLAWNRVQDAERRGALSGLTRGPQDFLEILHETHSLLVAANTFWKALDELQRRLRAHQQRLPRLNDVDSRLKACKQTVTARNHFEHLDERIREGRPRGNVMLRDAFRRAPAQVFRGVLRCGEESFDLQELVRAVEIASETVGPEVRDLLQPRPWFEVLPPQGE